MTSGTDLGKVESVLIAGHSLRVQTIGDTQLTVL
jgi:hypothetical protein